MFPARPKAFFGCSRVSPKFVNANDVDFQMVCKLKVPAVTFEDKRKQGPSAQEEGPIAVLNAPQEEADCIRGRPKKPGGAL
jgi:hypothetical protein